LNVFKCFEGDRVKFLVFGLSVKESPRQPFSFRCIHGLTLSSEHDLIIGCFGLLLNTVGRISDFTFVLDGLDSLDGLDGFNNGVTGAAVQLKLDI
jgi:hypothetical protein